LRGLKSDPVSFPTFRSVPKIQPSVIKRMEPVGAVCYCTYCLCNLTSLDTFNLAEPL